MFDPIGQARASQAGEEDDLRRSRRPAEKSHGVLNAGVLFRIDVWRAELRHASRESREETIFVYCCAQMTRCTRIILLCVVPSTTLRNVGNLTKHISNTTGPDSFLDQLVASSCRSSSGIRYIHAIICGPLSRDPMFTRCEACRDY